MSSVVAMLGAKEVSPALRDTFRILTASVLKPMPEYPIELGVVPTRFTTSAEPFWSPPRGVTPPVWARRG